MSLVRPLLRLSLLPTLLMVLGVATHADDVTWSPPNVVSVLKTDKLRGVILMPIEINGRRVQFVLDTGCAVSVFDRRLEHLAIKDGGSIEVTTGNKVAVIPTYKPPKFQFNGIELSEGGSIVVDDLEAARNAIGFNIFGIIGVDRLKQFSLYINYSQGSVVFGQPLSDDDTPPGQALPMKEVRHTPAIPITIGTKCKTFAVLDTGLFPTLLLANEKFEDLAETQELVVQSVYAGNNTSGLFDSKGRAASGRCSTIRVGDSHFENATFVSCKNSTALGLLFFSRNEITFDWKHKKVYVNPNDGLPMGDHGDFDGISFDGRKIKSVADGSLAKASGLKPGDILEAVADREMTKLWPREVLCTFCFAEGETLPLRIKHDDTIVSISVPRKHAKWSELSKEAKSTESAENASTANKP